MVFPLWVVHSWLDHIPGCGRSMQAPLCQQREQRSHVWIPLRSRELRIGWQTKPIAVADHDGEAVAAVQKIAVLWRPGGGLAVRTLYPVHWFAAVNATE